MMVDGQHCGDYGFQSSREFTRDPASLFRPRADESMAVHPRSFFPLVNDSLFGTYVVHDSRVLQVNRKFERIFGYEPNEIETDALFDWFIAEDEQKRVQGMMRDQLSGGAGEIHFEFRGRKRCGSEVWLEAFQRVVEHRNGSAVAGVVIDISDRVRAELQLRETNEALQNAMQERARIQRDLMEKERVYAIGMMASGVAHDFRNLLTPIGGFSELLLQSADRWNLPPRAVDQLGRIHGAAAQALAEVDRLTRAYAGDDQQHKFEATSLVSLIESAITISEPRWRSQGRNQQATIDFVTSMDRDAQVVCDPPFIRSAVTNLIFNAVDAMPAGGTVTVSLNWRADHSVEISVSDTGAGMSEEIRRRCLEPFFTTKGDRGTGLGLSMVRRCAELHGGKIEIESVEGQGTTFTLVIPGAV